jgi:hypothetical protein
LAERSEEEEMTQISDRIIISLDLQDMDAVVKAWLKQRIEWTEKEAAIVSHPEDIRAYKKDLKAFKRLLAYIGEL